MTSLVRLTTLFGLAFATVAAAPAFADYEGPDGYGGSTTRQYDVSHDGYAHEGDSAADSTTYVVIEAEDGQTEEIDGDTVIVVQEPEPVAATEHAPPAPPTVVVEQAVDVCPGGIWVDGYWAYGDGDYVWVDGHCVVERVNYVFVQPRWDFYSSVWWFVPGYYRPCGVYVGFGYYRPWHWYPPYYRSHYRSGHPVPVHRSVPRRPTTVRATSVSRTPNRGALSRPNGRTAAVERRPANSHGRTQTVDRVGRAPQRTGTVTRSPARTPTRTATVRRTPPSRTATAARMRPSSTRVGTVHRARPTPSRTTVVHRPPTPATRTGALGRGAGSPTLSSTVPRSRSGNSVVSRPRANPARTASVRRPASTPSSRPSVSRPTSGSARSRSVSRPVASPSRSGSVRRPSFGSSRGGSFGRPSFGGSRSGIGRGPSRPSMGGFGGARSVPTARGR